MSRTIHRRRTAGAALAAGAVAVACLACSTIGAHAAPASPSCTLTAMVLGGNPVISIYADGLRHNAPYEIDWTEPAITQVQYVSSNSRGALGQTVLNDQGSGTYRASVYLRTGGGDVFATSCSLSV